MNLKEAFLTDFKIQSCHSSGDSASFYDCQFCDTKGQLSEVSKSHKHNFITFVTIYGPADLAESYSVSYNELHGTPCTPGCLFAKLGTNNQRKS